MELLVGCRNARAVARVQQFLRYARVMPINTVASYIAYHLMQSFSLSHGLLIPDALIAATALEYDGTLYTKNVRHFRMIPGLNVVRPYYTTVVAMALVLHLPRNSMLRVP
jgi:hypothetical protein